MRTLVVLMLISALPGVIPAQTSRPISLPFADGFETTAVGKHPGANGWQVLSAGKHAEVTDAKAHAGTRSFRLESRARQGRVEYVLLPRSRSRFTFEVSVFPDTHPRRVVRVGFPQAFGNVNRFYNYFQVHSRDGSTGALFFQGHLRRRRVSLGPFVGGKWINLRADLDFEGETGTLSVNGKVVAGSVPIAPRAFDDPRHGRVVLDKWGFGERNWRGRGPGVFYVDDVRIAGLTGGDGEAVTRRIEQLNSPEATVRWHAIRALGRLGDPRAVEPLVGAMNKGNGTERCEAATALGMIGDPRAIEPLAARLADTHPELRRAAAKALGKFRERRALEALVGALSDPDPNVGYHASMALAEIGPMAIAPLIEALKAGGRAAGSAGPGLVKIGSPAVPPLLEALKSDSVGVRCAVIDLLRKFRVKRTAEPLIRLLREDDSWRVREQAALALRGRRNKIALEPLVAALRKEHLAVRQQAASSLGTLGDPRAVEPLIEALGDPNGQLRVNAASSLGALGDARAVEPLIALLDDRSVVARETAYLALGKLGGERALAVLIERLKAGDARSRASAAGALGGFADERAVAPLVAALRDTDAGVRVCAAVALDRLRWQPADEPREAWYLVARKRWREAAQLGSAAVEPLVLAIQSQDATVRSGAASALAKLGEPAIEPLLAIAKHGDASVRKQVARTLRALGWAGSSDLERARILVRSQDWAGAVKMGPVAVSPLRDALKDVSEPVRIQAARSLVKLGWKPETKLDRAYLLVPSGKFEEVIRLGDVAFEPLVLAVKDPRGRLAPLAAEALGTLGNARAKDALLQLLRTGPTAARLAAAKALATLGHPPPLDPFVAVLRHPDPREGVDAAKALGELGDRRALPHLRAVRDAMKHHVAAKLPADPRAQAYVMWYRILHCTVAAAMVRLGEKQCLADVIAALKDEIPRVRWQAAWSLGACGAAAKSAVPALERALEDQEPRVREAASDALRKIRAAVRKKEKNDFVAVLPATKGGSPFLRLLRGNFWEYRVQKRNKTTVGKIEVTGVFADGQIRVRGRNVWSDADPTMMWKPAGDFLIWEWQGFDWKVVKFGGGPKAAWTSAGKTHGPDLVLRSEVVDVEDVVTPAGKLADCLKIRSRLEDKRSAAGERHDMFMWWARGVGLVRLEVVDDRGVKERWTLIAYKVG